MASVMRRAIELDEETETHDAELIAQLRHENVSLRSLIRDMDDGRCQVTTMIDSETQVTIDESEAVASESDDAIAITTSCGGDGDEGDLESVADSGRETAVSESVSTISVCSEKSNNTT